jgi:hypothetical protein
MVDITSIFVWFRTKSLAAYDIDFATRMVADRWDSPKSYLKRNELRANLILFYLNLNKSSTNFQNIIFIFTRTWLYFYFVRTLKQKRFPFFITYS